MSKLNFEFDVRIPDALVQQMMDGEITASMLIAMTILYKWSNWSTGKVRRVCAASLCYASHEAYSERTFSEALRKLEWMRWITRRMVAGSHKWYPVTIHNYKIVDDAGKVHILNPTDIKVYDKFPEGRCDEASDETSYEGSDEASYETSDSHESELKSEHQSSNESSPKPKEVLSFSQSVSLGTGVPLAEDQETDKTLQGSEFVSEEQKQTQEKIKTLADEIGSSMDIPAVLGIPYFHDGHDLTAIATVLYYRNRSVYWLAHLVAWAKGVSDPKDREGQFWKRKLETGDKAVANLTKYLETGRIAEQFDARLVAKNGSEVFNALKDNHWLYRTYVHLAAKQPEPDYSKPLTAGGNFIGYEAKVEPEPGSMESIIKNRSKAVGAAGFEHEEAE
jgi:hypothetical protein